MVLAYSLYGLCVEAQVEMPAPLIDCKKSPDVYITFDKQSPPLQEAGDQQYYFSVSPQFAQFQHRHVALFTIIKGREIIISPLSAVDPRIIVNTLLGSPFGILLLQRDHLVFHASAVEINGRSICFLGSSGSGKSTTACSCISLGHQLISDDVVAFNTASKSQPIPLPGYPWMKIGEKACSDLKLNACMLSELQQFSPKKKYSMGEGMFAGDPEKLQCIYIPSWGDTLSIEPVKSQLAVIHLISHAYGFVPRVNYPEEEKQRFLRLTKFAKDTPCFLLQRPRNVNTITQISGVLEKHLSTLD